MLENEVDYKSDIEALVVCRNDYAILVLFLSFTLLLFRHSHRSLRSKALSNFNYLPASFLQRSFLRLNFKPARSAL